MGFVVNKILFKYDVILSIDYIDSLIKLQDKSRWKRPKDNRKGGSIADSKTN